MEFMDEWKDKATDVAAVTGQKMAELYSVAKLKIAISDKKSQIRKLYRELGQVVYKAAKGEISEDDNLSVDMLVAKIDDAVSELEELNLNEKMLKNLKLCPYCGEGMEKRANFCSNCGKESAE